MQAATITDEDIDAIIQKGQQSTEELNKKLKDFSDNAMKFQMDGGIAYDFEEEKEDQEDIDYKQLAGAPSAASNPCSKWPNSYEKHQSSPAWSFAEFLRVNFEV